MNDEIKNHQNLDKGENKKKEIKRRRVKLKNIIHYKLELITKLKNKKLSQKSQEKNSEIKTIRNKWGKIKYAKIENEGLN